MQTRRSNAGFRRSSRSRAALVNFVALFAVSALPTRAEAQFMGPMPVIDAAAIARLATQIRNQVQQLTVARNQLQLQVANMKKLGNPGWRTIAATLGQIDALTQQGIAIWYSLQSVDAEFQKTFPGWKLSSTMPTDMRAQQERTLATLRSAVNAANITAQQLAVANARLTGMKGLVGSITSAQQAAELMGVIGIHTAEEVTLLRQQLAAQGNAQAVYLANQVNRETQAAAAADAFRTAGATTPVRTRNMTVAAVGIP